MNVFLSQHSDEPIYAQIHNQVRRHILSGELSAGESLPSIRQLAKDQQISVITTKRAYEELEKEGLIASVVGKGSFVTHVSADNIRDARLKLLDQKLIDALTEARSLSLRLEEVQQRVSRLYEEESI